jgi:hypothetical protein
MTKLVTAAVAVLLLFVFGFFTGCRVERTRSNRERLIDSVVIADYQRSEARLKAEGRKIDTVYTADTVRLRSIRTRWDTVRLVTKTTDTLVSVDTLRLVVRVADSTIGACTEALVTCEAKVANLNELRRVDSTQIRSQSREIARLNRRRWFACAAGPTVIPSRASWIGATCGVSFRLPVPF